MTESENKIVGGIFSIPGEEPNLTYAIDIEVKEQGGKIGEIVGFRDEGSPDASIICAWPPRRPRPQRGKPRFPSGGNGAA